MIIVETRSFTARIDDLLTADEYRWLQLELVQQPTASETILMLFAYSKNEREDLTSAQREALRLIVEREYP